MYKVIASFWSRAPPNQRRDSTTRSHVHEDADGWLVVSDAVIVAPSTTSPNIMTNSWIATPPLIKNDEPPIGVLHLNPIENLLIEHASMSVYEQIASKARNKRLKGLPNDKTVNEEEEEPDGDLDDQTSVDYHHSTAMGNLDASLIAHQRRACHRRKRANKSAVPITAIERPPPRCPQ